MTYLFIATTIAAVAWAVWLLYRNARLQERINIIDSTEPERRAADDSHFRSLATELMERNSQLLDPLRSELDSFRRAVNDSYARECSERVSLRDRIVELAEAHRDVGRQAHELSTALRGGSKIQGDWGEMVLESILERSGLRQGEEFVVQSTVSDADTGQRRRPDVVVRYPGGRFMVIDSKVSLTAFLELVDADTPEARKAAGRRHVQSVRNHIAELRRKNYQELTGGEKSEFVMMFMPSEPAYIAAMRLEPSLWQEAFDAKVVIVSPTLITSALRIVEQLWQRDRRERHAEKIAEEAGKMCDKLAGFLNDMDTVGKALERARTAFDGAMGKLSEGRGNILDRARKLTQMGAHTTRRLPEAPDSEAD